MPGIPPFCASVPGIPAGHSDARDPGRAVMSWHVDDPAAALDRLFGMGATEYEPVTERGTGGPRTASVARSATCSG